MIPRWLFCASFRAQQLDSVLQVTGRQVGIPGRHLDRLVPHQFLNRFQRHASHYQSATKGVPETVPGKIPDLGLCDRLLKQSPDRFPDERLSLIGHEDPFALSA